MVKIPKSYEEYLFIAIENGLTENERLSKDQWQNLKKEYLATEIYKLYNEKIYKCQTRQDDSYNNYDRNWH